MRLQGWLLRQLPTLHALRLLLCHLLASRHQQLHFLPSWVNIELRNVFDIMQFWKSVNEWKMFRLPNQLFELLRSQHLHAMLTQLQPHTASGQRSVDHRLLASHCPKSNCASCTEQIISYRHSGWQQRDLPRADIKHSSHLLPHNQLPRLHRPIHSPDGSKQPWSLVQHPIRPKFSILVRDSFQLRCGLCSYF